VGSFLDIDERMKAAFGPDWTKHQVPGDILKAWREKRRKAMDNGEQACPLIAYADFTDYVPLTTRKDNWEKYSSRYSDGSSLCRNPSSGFTPSVSARCTPE
jgi:hypothetical protein